MPKTYDKKTASFLAKVAESMPDIPDTIMQGWIQNPLLLQSVLKGLYPWQNQEIWRFRCALSTSQESRTKSSLLLNNGKFTLAHWGRKLFDAAFPETPSYDGECLTIRLKLSRLGFTKRVSLADFKKRANQFGLVECPLFVAYHYRIRYEKQPLDERLYILTKSVDIGGGVLSLFGLTHHLRAFKKAPYNSTSLSSLLWLDGHYGGDAILWEPDSEWVFALKQ